jgi:hypothetical protein
VGVIASSRSRLPYVHTLHPVCALHPCNTIHTPFLCVLPSPPAGCTPQVLYRLYLAEKLKEPFRKGSRRPDAAVLAARDATRLEAQQVCVVRETVWTHQLLTAAAGVSCLTKAS